MVKSQKSRDFCGDFCLVFINHGWVNLPSPLRKTSYFWEGEGVAKLQEKSPQQKHIQVAINL